MIENFIQLKLKEKCSLSLGRFYTEHQKVMHKVSEIDEHKNVPETPTLGREESGRS
jgi:hypothetical protein